MLGENGPYIVQEDLSLKINPNSWNSNATVLWIDQPAGSGFSYGSYITNEDEMASDMWEFLGAFMAKYKAAGRDYSALPFHVIGESYAGPVDFLQNTFSDRNALHYTATARILIPAECSAVS